MLRPAAADTQRPALALKMWMREPVDPASMTILQRSATLPPLFFSKPVREKGCERLNSAAALPPPRPPPPLGAARGMSASTVRMRSTGTAAMAATPRYL